MADAAESSMAASSPVSGLESGMATLTFKAINEPRSPDQGGDQAVVDNTDAAAGNADGAKSKENRRRTASLERYR